MEVAVAEMAASSAEATGREAVEVAAREKGMQAREKVAKVVVG